MPTEGYPVHGELEQELTNSDIIPAKHSTKEYYEKWRGESYKLNLESDKRGRAIIFTMTERRPGWEEDVKSLYMMLKSINVDVERVYDPDYNGICADLKAFVEHSDNHHIDICFVIFMGHGYSTRTNLHDVILQIKEGTINIWAESVNIFRKETSLLREKPKVFIVQSCRSVDDRRPDLGVISLGSPASFTDYKFIFASQPGTVAHRENHLFIDTLTNLVTQEAHWKHLGDLIIKLCMKFREHQHFPGVDDQMPQTWESFSRYLNIFPGITKDLLEASGLSLKVPQQESEGSIQGESKLSILTDATNTLCFEKNLKKLQGKKPNTQPTGTPEENKPNSKDTSSNSIQNQKGQSCSSSSQSKDEEGNKQDAKEESNGQKTDNVEDKSNAPKCQAILQIKVKVEPSSDSQVQKTEEVLFNSVKRETQRNDMEEMLTTECETPVTIDDLTKGSISLHITCDIKALETLRFLSETGLLSSKFSSLLVTKSFLQRCCINQVTLEVKLKIVDEKVLKMLAPMVYCLPFNLVYVRKCLKMKVPIQTSGAGQWFHDGTPIRSDGRISISTNDDNLCVLEVKEACESDSGVYCLKCTSTDGFPTEVKVTVLIMNQSAPFNVKAEAADKEINLSWDPAVGEITAYSIKCLHESGTDAAMDLVVSGTTHETITDVRPGETYKVYVRSVSKDGVSDPEPPEGLTVHTQPETPVGHFIKEPRSSGLCRIIWENSYKSAVFMVIKVTNLKESVNADNTYVVPSHLNRFYINLMDNCTKISGFTHPYNRGKYSHSCSLSSFYKGSMSRKFHFDKGIKFSSRRKMDFIVRKSTQEYYNAMKDSSYPLNMGTLKRGRAIVFVTEGQSMDFQMDLLKLFASLSIQYWIIHDPDVETIDWYLKEAVQKKEHDNVDYCLVFFIGRHCGSGNNTHFVTQETQINIFEKCQSVLVEDDKRYRINIPIFIVVITNLCCETKPLSDEPKHQLKTAWQNFDFHLMYANTRSECDKWSFLKIWVDSVIDNCDHMSLEDIAEQVVRNLVVDWDEKENKPCIVSLLSQKLNLFPGLTKDMIDDGHTTKFYDFKKAITRKQMTRQEVAFSDLETILTKWQSYQQSLRSLVSGVYSKEVSLCLDEPKREHIEMKTDEFATSNYVSNLPSKCRQLGYMPLLKLEQDLYQEKPKSPDRKRRRKRAPATSTSRDVDVREPEIKRLFLTPKQETSSLGSMDTVSEQLGNPDIETKPKCKEEVSFKVSERL